jgi:hypothetical protein
MEMERLSHRKTPANPSRKGTTALLNTLLDRLFPSRPMMGLPEYRQTASRQPAGFSYQGRLGIALPMIFAMAHALLFIFNRTAAPRRRLDEGIIPDPGASVNKPP